MDTLTLTKTRHSTRKFLQIPVEKEKIEQTCSKRFGNHAGIRLAWLFLFSFRLEIFLKSVIINR